MTNSKTSPTKLTGLEKMLEMKRKAGRVIKMSLLVVIAGVLMMLVGFFLSHGVESALFILGLALFTPAYLVFCLSSIFYSMFWATGHVLGGGRSLDIGDRESATQ